MQDIFCAEACILLNNNSSLENYLFLFAAADQFFYF